MVLRERVEEAIQAEYTGTPGLQDVHWVLVMVPVVEGHEPVCRVMGDIATSYVAGVAMAILDECLMLVFRAPVSPAMKQDLLDRIQAQVERLFLNARVAITTGAFYSEGRRWPREGEEER